MESNGDDTKNDRVKNDIAKNDIAKNDTAKKTEPDPKAKTVNVAKSGLVLIVNKANAVASLSRSQLEDIYFGRTLSWPNGARVRPYARPGNTEAAKIFFSPATGVDAGRYSQHWQQRQLSGAGLAPGNVETAVALIKVVAANPGAIGYLSGAELPSNMDGVRVVELRSADERR